MIEVKHTEVWGFEHAIRGMRNPLNSWHLSDSEYNEEVELGEKDLGLAKRLKKAGTDHRKYLRQVFVSMDVTAPLFWYKEFDTYKIGTVANSTSTMHKIQSKEITLDDFSFPETEMAKHLFGSIVEQCEALRALYNETKDKKHWELLIAILPSGYNQTRTITLNYEVLTNIYHSRKNHKLVEWREFCEWVETLPYASELIIGE